MNKLNKGSRIITICYTVQTTAAGEADKDRKEKLCFREITFLLCLFSKKMTQQK